MGKVLSKRSSLDTTLLTETPDDILFLLCDLYLTFKDVLILAQCNRKLNQRVSNYLRFKVTEEKLEKWVLFQEKIKTNDEHLNIIIYPLFSYTREENREEEGYFSPTEMLLQNSGFGIGNALENKWICLFLKVLSLIENCDVWRASVSSGGVHATYLIEKDPTLDREIIVVENTKILRFFLYFILPIFSDVKNKELSQLYSASIFLKLDNNFNWPLEVKSKWSLIESFGKNISHSRPWKDPDNKFHSVEVDNKWWKQVLKGNQDFSLNNIRVVREVNGWVRVDLFYDNPIKFNTNKIILELEDWDGPSRQQFRRGIRFDCWQLNRHR